MEFIGFSPHLNKFQFSDKIQLLELYINEFYPILLEFIAKYERKN